VKDVVIMSVPNLSNGITSNGRVIEPSLGRDLTAHHHQIAFGVSFASHSAACILGQAGVKHRIGNCIANFVRMAFADGLRGKDIVFAHELGLAEVRRNYHIDVSGFEDIYLLHGVNWIFQKM
jgi:hypothetical protein